MAAPHSILENVKIVVVDDRPDFRFLVAKFLAERGAHVVAAKNAFEGIRLVREIRPDIVLSDLNMPGRTGFELLADIRALRGEEGGSVPVIAETAFGPEDDLIREAGFQNCLRKPFTPDQLIATIDSVLHT